MALTVHEISMDERAAFQDRITDLEKGVSYPLGSDRFELDHGDDYFAFFDRMGKLSYFVVRDGERVVAVAAAILREFPPKPGLKPRRAWYGCDLKVDPDYRRERIPWKMLLYGFPRKYPICGRGYGVTMNPDGGRENPVVRLVSRFSIIASTVATQLIFYSLTAGEMERALPTLRRQLGPISFLSLRGQKDIVLQSTGAAMPLLHLQHGPCGVQGELDPKEKHVHMFCLPENDPLHAPLGGLGLSPSATAAVLQHRMGNYDWRFILTSDI